MAVDSAVAGLLLLAGRGIQHAEAAVAVRLERAHAEFLGQGEGLVVVGCGRLHLRRRPMRRNLAEEAQGIGLVAPFLVRTGKRQRALGEGVRLLQAASQHCASPRETTERLDSRLCSVAVVCSSACVSSGRASATRPPSVYAAPKAAAIAGK